MTWYLAPALTTLRNEVNRLAPTRSKRSDGTIGDSAHSARRSDHNPDPDSSPPGEVRAIDFTHDPPAFDAHAFAETLRVSKDLRISYVISNRRIFSSIREPWRWRPYSGSNPHSAHVHVSVTAAGAKDTSAWLQEEDMTPEQAQMLTELHEAVTGNRGLGAVWKALYKTRESDGAKVRVEHLDVIEEMIRDMAHHQGMDPDALAEAVVDRLAARIARDG